MLWLTLVLQLQYYPCEPVGEILIHKDHQEENYLHNPFIS
jgi:hypothetical protein